MKTTIILPFALASVQAVSFDPNSCPISADTSVCHTAYNLVRCGDDECEYSNECWAQSAGFDVATECVEVCPYDADATAHCFSADPTEGWAGNEPYECGYDMCYYSSACEAEANGFDIETECLPAFCPSIPGDAECTYAWEPLQCGHLGCLYFNECEALAAGVDLDTCTSVSECAVAMDFCPSNEDDETLECGEDACLYLNACEAESAGFDVEAECQAAYCPVIDEETDCADLWDPVECGDRLCVYDNQCFASSAGFAESDCAPTFGQTVI